MADDEKKQDKTFSEEEIRKVEEELKAKKAAEEAAKDAEHKSMLEKLAEDSVKKGKEEALKEFEETSRRKAQDEELKRLADENRKMKEEMDKKISEIAKQSELRIQELESQRKGFSKNESPFQQGQTTKVPQFKPEEMAEIDQKSMVKFYEYLGRPPPPI